MAGLLLFKGTISALFLELFLENKMHWPGVPLGSRLGSFCDVANSTKCQSLGIVQTVNRANQCIKYASLLKAKKTTTKYPE